MNIFNDIPIPPLPGGALGLCISAAAIVAGLLLLLIGHKLIWRILPAIAAGAAAFAGGDYLAVKIGCDSLLASIGLSAAAGLAGLVGARLFWIVAFSLLLALLVLGVLVDIFAASEGPPPGGFDPAENMSQWYEGFSQTMEIRKGWLVSEHRREVALAMAATMAFGLLLATHKPIIARIICICTGGTVLLIAGISYTLLATVGDIDFSAGHRPIAMAAISVGVFLAAAIRQWRAERKTAAQRQELAEQLEKQPEAKEKPGPKPKKVKDRK